jgi:cobalt-zinc-cadmium efflux system protein
VFAISKLIKALKILLQKVPENVNIPALHQKILCLDKVKEVKNLKVWSLTADKIVATVQVQVTNTKELKDLKEI